LALFAASGRSPWVTGGERAGPATLSRSVVTAASLDEIGERPKRALHGPPRDTKTRHLREIVAAYVAHNQVAASDLPKVIRAVAGGLSTSGRESEAAVPSKPEPAIPVRRSVRPDYLVCLICGKKQKLLKRHLAVEHELTPKQYRETFELKPDYPMAAPGYSQQRRELAHKIGLGRPKKAMRQRRRKAAGAEES
jgi:predicted transcriptional regulator